MIFVKDVMLRGFISTNSARIEHLILLRFKYVRCCIAADHDRPERSTEWHRDEYIISQK